MSERKPTTDKRIAAELRRIKRAHAQLVGEPDADRIMERLASLRVKFRQLDSAIQEGGGAKEETAGMVAELRQLSRACSSLEAQLTRPTFQPAAGNDAILLMAQTRRALVDRARERQALEGEPARPAIEHKPFSAAELIRRQRDDDLN